MNAIENVIPACYLAAAPPAVADENTTASCTSGSIPALALVVGLLLLGAHAPDTNMVPPTEIQPFNDTQRDLSLGEVVARFEQNMGADQKEEAHRLGKLLMELSEHHRISPSLILAVIESESSFRPSVISKAGAMGLMQLQPETAAHVAAIYHIHAYHSEEDLMNPAVNLRLGVAYLAYLRHRFGQSLHYLAAYNVGPTALRHRLQQGNYELGSLDTYVRTIHQRARDLRGAHGGAKLPGLAREEALYSASL